MKTLFFLAALFSFSVFAEGTCKLPKGEKITIGCTYENCGSSVRYRIRSAALLLGYKVQFVDLTSLPQSKLDHIADLVDTVLIPGGADIHPKYYLRDVSRELREYTQENLHLAILTDEGKKRDLFEYSLLKLLLLGGERLKKLPVLGICRGMQMMSVAQGIPLYLDIKTELGIPNRHAKWDKIHITDEESLMQKLYKGKSFRAFEQHHQGIRVDYFEQNQSQYKNVKVSSFSNDGKVAESIEYIGHTALGVQYHPEKSLPKATFPIFKWYLTKACEYKNAYKDQP